MPQGFIISEEIKNNSVVLRKKGVSLQGVFDTYYRQAYKAAYQEDARFETFRRNLSRWVKQSELASEGSEKKIEKLPALENFVPKVRVNKWDGNEIIKFGLIGDPHINSKYVQLTWLHNFYDTLVEQEIPICYNAGDMTSGEHMRTGHEYEIYRHGADEQVAEIVRTYPKRTGIETHFITGNHDASIYKVAGCDVGKAIARERNDMVYLGRDCAVVNIAPKCSIELRHPWNGAAYALSYHPQKIIESMEADSKPNILAIGHYHKALYLFYRNIHCFCTGCFQSQTPFMRGKGLAAHMGGWIITAYVDENGYLRLINPQFIPYYYPIKDDYLNFALDGQRSSNEYQ